MNPGSFCFIEFRKSRYIFVSLLLLFVKLEMNFSNISMLIFFFVLSVNLRMTVYSVVVVNPAEMKGTNLILLTGFMNTYLVFTGVLSIWYSTVYQIILSHTNQISIRNACLSLPVLRFLWTILSKSNAYSQPKYENLIYLSTPSANSLYIWIRWSLRDPDCRNCTNSILSAHTTRYSLSYHRNWYFCATGLPHHSAYLLLPFFVGRPRTIP